MKLLITKNNCDDIKVSFKIVMQKTIIDDLISKNEIIKKLKLTSVINTSNMHLFDEDCKIKKVSCPEEIIYKFYKVRNKHFISRKKYLIDTLSEELKILDTKIKFIKYVISEKIVVFNKKKEIIIKQIEKVGDLIQINNSWDYLLELKLWTFTEERISDLIQKMESLKEKIENIKNTSTSQMWISELNMINY